MQPSDIEVHDQYCGCGGNTISVVAEGGKVTHAWNHKEIAIETHSSNFPQVEHELTDIFDVDPHRYKPATMLITSPECRAHTDANGKKKPSQQLSMFDEDELVDEADERSRMTMSQVVRFAEALQYEIILLENVVQLLRWRFWEDWKKEIRNLDYNIQEVYWNSAFFAPTPQSRDRIYVVCTKKHLPLPDLTYRPRAWCARCERDVESVQVWRKRSRPWGKWRQQYDYCCSTPGCGQTVIPYYYAAANVIDWSLEAPRIGDRDKPLFPNTRRRVEYGLNKFEGHPSIVDLAYAYTTGHDRRATSLIGPYPTQTTAQTHSLVVPPGPPPLIVPLDHLTDPESKSPEPLDRPLSTQTGRQDKALVVPPYIVELRKNGTASSLERWLATVTAGGNHHALVQPPFITSYYSKDGGHALTDSLPTQPAHERHALVMPQSKVSVDDCGFRMLKWWEIRRAMAFPDDYILKGTNRQRVDQLGNATTPPPVRRLVKACFEVLNPRQI